MAENKKSFILYTDLISVVEKLVLKDRENKTNFAGELFLHILKYVNDQEPIAIDFIVEMAFEPIKLSLKRDLKKYSNYIEKQRENGKKGGRPKKPTQSEKTQPFLLKPKKADSVSVSDSVINNTYASPTAKGNINFDKLLIFINQTTCKSFRVINDNTKAKYKARLKDGYTPEDIKNAIINACNDPYHKDNGFKYLKPEYFSRADSLDLHAFKKVKTISKHLENPYKSQL